MACSKLGRCLTKHLKQMLALNWRPRALPRPLCKRQFWTTKTKQVLLADNPATAENKVQQLLCQLCQDWHDDAVLLIAGRQSVCSILPQPDSQNSRPRLTVQHHTATGYKSTSLLASNSQYVTATEPSSHASKMAETHCGFAGCLWAFYVGVSKA